MDIVGELLLCVLIVYALAWLGRRKDRKSKGGRAADLIDEFDQGKKP
jgi:hypothetical protein